MEDEHFCFIRMSLSLLKITLGEEFITDLFVSIFQTLRITTFSLSRLDRKQRAQNKNKKRKKAAATTNPD